MDFVLIAFLTLLNGAFAMSELALASSRRARLGAMAEDGDKGAATALQLLEHPTQFLSSVQVGITSIGMLNGIVGEAAFSDDLGRWFLSLGLDPRVAGVLATALVVTAITFITIVFGELVPKRIGQLYPETVARWVSRPMAAVAQGAKPFVWLLTHTTQWVLKLLRVDNSAAQVVTEEEIKASLAEGVDAGIIEAQEHRMVRNVFGLDDRQLNSIMLPASEIEWLDARDSIDEALRKAGASGHSWYPVCRNGLRHTVLSQQMNHRPRSAVGAVGGIRRRRIGKHIIGVETGELIYALQPLFFQPGLGHVQQVEILVERLQRMGENQQGGVDSRLLLQTEQFRGKGQQQALGFRLLAERKMNASTFILAAGKRAQIEANHSLLQPAPGGQQHPVLSGAHFFTGFFLRLLLAAALPEALSFFGPL